MKKRVLEFLRESGLELEDGGVLDVLLKGSSLTEPQLETLLIEYASSINGRRMDTLEKASLRGVSKGAYATTKAQALNNIKRSIYTLLLLRYLGILGDEWLSRIMEAADLLGRGEVYEAVEILESLRARDITGRV